LGSTINYDTIDFPAQQDCVGEAIAVFAKECSRIEKELRGLEAKLVELCVHDHSNNTALQALEVEYDKHSRTLDALEVKILSFDANTQSEKLDQLTALVEMYQRLGIDEGQAKILAKMKTLISDLR